MRIRLRMLVAAYIQGIDEKESFGFEQQAISIFGDCLVCFSGFVVRKNGISSRWSGGYDCA